MRLEAGLSKADSQGNERFWITRSPDQLDGVPCVRGLRIPASTVLLMLAEGMSDEEILHAYPDLEKEDIRQVLIFAAGLVDKAKIV